MKGTIYMIPCPIADTRPLWDVLPRANYEVMNSLDYFIVENVRSARRFLAKAGVERRIEELEFVELNEHTTKPEDVERMLRPVLEGRSAGVISEAGVPGVADPGADIVALAHRHGIRVVPLVGPSSILMSVMASGLNGQSFAFVGYLPVKEGERERRLRELERRAQQERQAQLFIEAPYRNVKLFEALLKILSPKMRLSVATDITAPEEYIRTLRVEEWRKVPMPDIAKRPTIFLLGI
ncbi:MAG: SAM-dependent methyltransferase [Alistipes sp.]|nr:SAM-dependent methyltransferase [Alistipes sp.]MBQ3248442.1 SAM-dependent methyltransferase [Alistipes sp.]MBR3826223.1 SAM-dependent methyltransferase [Alistipes sp.]